MEFTEAQIENRKRDIPIHGGYSQWSYWWKSSCSKLCGGGIQKRFRKCNKPSPANRGRDCSRLGRATETRSCNTHKCPGKGFTGKEIRHKTRREK
ncbi:A disintegrin and metalloproteinase with thrombospondin motifs 4-like [Oculina patagonica]